MANPPDIPIFKLHNQIKHYEWGSPCMIPQFLGVENPGGKAWAEMWMGTHPAAPSQIQTGESAVSLAELAGELPFLFKLLAVEKPLSLQAHPNTAQAQEGFARENSLSIALDASDRSYRDANHKPELLCAVSPFTVMAGFKQPDQIYRSLETFISSAPAAKFFSRLLPALEAGALKCFFTELYKFSKQELKDIVSFILENEAGIASDKCAVLNDQWKLMKYFAALYPEDIAVISPLYLNLFTLDPGQAIYIPTGILHSYISGFGVELMTNSDNVLRCGLTSKHTGIGELMNILKFEPFMPQIIVSPPSPSWFCIPAPEGDFSLSLMCSNGEKPAERIFSGNAPAICIVTDGELHTGGVTFKKGESFFIPAEATGGGLPSFSGNYSLFAAGGSVK